jgi:FAD/FMN-containing dehydrogenase
MIAQQDAQVGRALVEGLRASLRGEVIDPAHPAYDRARRVWNGLIDRHPGAVARCAEVEDVVQAVRVAREQWPVVSIRGGGHQVAGSAVCDAGLVIDLSGMKAVEVDADARTARVQAGATWAEVDRATQEFGLATTGGEVSATGVAGLTLGGGLGVMMRAFGLSCDNLRSIEIVTADGKIRTASPDENADLFWAACGGGRGAVVPILHRRGLCVKRGRITLVPFGPCRGLIVCRAAPSFTPCRDRALIRALNGVESGLTEYKLV